jgi:predicted transcriptional regulator
MDVASTPTQQELMMNFLDKYFDFPKFPRVRSNDPITSFEASDSIKEVAKHHSTVILDCLKDHGPLGKDGISQHTKLDKNQVSRRLNELEKLGLIIQTGRIVKSSANRNEREWAFGVPL